jgi:tRNA modification GTPase
LPGDTIYAPATAAGRAPVGVLRISGPAAAAAARLLTGKDPPPPRTAALRRLRDPDTGEAIDQALLLWFPAPRSETGEDVLEVQHHGGAAVLAGLVSVLARASGVRPAKPGEFTRRAFLNGKLDLTAAEGLADLIDATTRAQARQALRQLDGELGRVYGIWRERLLNSLALLEAEIDFAPDQDVPGAMLAQVLPDLAVLRGEMARHLADEGKGERLRVGVTVAVIGAPNVGKSSLVNLLARREVAIVTALAGTTRDVIEVQLDLEGTPVVLLDTAGLRETDDPIEAAGVERARRRAADADLLVHVVDATDPAPPLLPDGRTLLVFNKIDLLPGEVRDDIGLAVSCQTGVGLSALVAELGSHAATLVTAGTNPVLTRARYRTAVAEALGSLDRFVAEAGHGAELALLAEDLRLAARAIGSIVGAVGVEDVLDRIFASFCIGK